MRRTAIVVAAAMALAAMLTAAASAAAPGYVTFQEARHWSRLTAVKLATPFTEDAPWIRIDQCRRLGQRNVVCRVRIYADRLHAEVRSRAYETPGGLEYVRFGQLRPLA